MIKAEIVEKIHETCDVSRAVVHEAIDAVIHTMREALGRGDRIEIRGFGVFVVKPKKSGMGRNPRTGEEVAIQPGRTVRFKPGKRLRQ